MVDQISRLALSILRVPLQPHPPFGDPASLRVFRAGRNYYRLRMATWAGAQILALCAFIFWTAILIEVEATVHERQSMPAAPVGPPEASEAPAGPDASAAPANPAPDAPEGGTNWVERGAEKIRTAAQKVTTHEPDAEPTGIREWIAGYIAFFVELALLLPPWGFPLVWVVKVLSFGIYLLQIPITYAIRRLDYEMRWYMVTDRSLRLRHGVWHVTESTMSFANVQKVEVIQGPLQRLLGLSDVKVQSAGGGAKMQEHTKIADDMHVGLVRHVTNALEIRDLIGERLRRFRESGLGDPEEQLMEAAAPPARSSASDAAVEAALDLLAEAKALRAVLK